MSYRVPSEDIRLNYCYDSNQIQIERGAATFAFNFLWTYSVHFHMENDILASTATVCLH